MTTRVSIDSVRAQAFEIPTDKPEADGTIAWNSTTLVLVEISGWWRDRARLHLFRALHRRVDRRQAGFSDRGPRRSQSAGAWLAMQRGVRNLGREGLAATAISAVDAAIHDLKARLLGLPLLKLLGSYRDSVPIYGSGGFTTYSDDELQDQLAVGCRTRAAPRQDEGRLGSGQGSRARQSGRSRRSATRRCSSMPTAPTPSSRRYDFAMSFAEQQVGWFEEPVSSDDLTGSRRPGGGLRPEWKSRPANMPTPWIMCARCWRRRQSMCSKRT